MLELTVDLDPDHRRAGETLEEIRYACPAAVTRVRIQLDVVRTETGLALFGHQDCVSFERSAEPDAAGWDEIGEEFMRCFFEGSGMTLVGTRFDAEGAG